MFFARKECFCYLLYLLAIKKNSVRATITKTSSTLSQLSTPRGDMARTLTANRASRAPCRTARTHSVGDGASRRLLTAPRGTANADANATNATARNAAYVKTPALQRSGGATKMSR